MADVEQDSAWAYELTNQQLLGTTLVRVRLNGIMLMLDFNNGVGAQFWDPWRITKGELLYGSGDITQPREELIPVDQSQLSWLPLGSRLTAVEIEKPFHDVKLSFSDGSRVEHILESSNYESWYLVWPHHHLVCGGVTGFSYWDNLPS